MAGLSPTVRSREAEFTLDPFQTRAVAAVDRGASVLVAAPTSAGKTVIAEHAATIALNAGGRVFYTTPIKALSNQKFNDFCALFGSDRVGLATGDNSIRPNADLVVMTTEVLRNMLYSAGAQRSTDRLMWVVLDEVHYLGDPYRGTAWEEVVINTAADVRFVCLSATISNAETFGRWLRERRGPTEVVVSTKRPVELHNLHMIHDNHEGQITEFAPTGESGKASPKWGWIAQNRHRSNHNDDWDDDDWDDDDWDDDWDQPRSWRFSTPTHSAVVSRLRQHRILPALFFVFSRAGCDRAAAQLAASLTLANSDEADKIAQIASRRLAHLTATERTDLNAAAWVASIRSGVAAHHAGLLPAFKETVEECFIAGLIKVVFATETLALGMHMPARTVVINTLTKFNGTSHELLRPIEFTQISGRAGRRGIDTEGHCVTLWSPYVEPSSVVSLHRGEASPLTSVFAPNYNMVANLAARHTRETAETILDRSFAQFLVDEQLKGRVDELERLETQRETCRTLARSPYGDVSEYRNLLNTPTKHLEAASAKLKRGSVIADPDNTAERLVVIGTKRTSAKTITLARNGATPAAGNRNRPAEHTNQAPRSRVRQTQTRLSYRRPRQHRRTSRRHRHQTHPSQNHQTAQHPPRETQPPCRSPDQPARRQLPRRAALHLQFAVRDDPPRSRQSPVTGTDVLQTPRVQKSRRRRAERSNRTQRPANAEHRTHPRRIAPRRSRPPPRRTSRRAGTPTHPRLPDRQTPPLSEQGKEKPAARGHIRCRVRHAHQTRIHRRRLGLDRHRQNPRSHPPRTRPPRR